MKSYQKILSELIQEKYSTDELINAVDNALRYYSKDNITNVLDIGFGIGMDSLYFASNNVNVTALDGDIDNVTYLMKRKNEKSLDRLSINHTLFDENYGTGEKFSLVILSNIIHFWEVAQTETLLNLITEKLIDRNGLLFLKFHSKKWGQVMASLNSNSSFIHFYDSTEINQILTNSYKKIFQSTLERRISNVEYNLFLEAHLKFYRQSDPEITEEAVKEILRNYEPMLGEDNVTLIYKKI